MTRRPANALWFALLTAAFALGAAAAPDRSDDSAGRDLRPYWVQYLGMPEDKRRQLLLLHRDLHEEDLQDRERLLKVMLRYCEWLERLPADRRTFVESAGSTEEKLRRIRKVREEQWIAALPRIDRERLKAAEAYDNRRGVPPAILFNPVAAALDSLPLRDRLLALLREREQRRDAELQGTLFSIGDGAALVRLQQQVHRQEAAAWTAQLARKPLSDDERRQLEASAKFPSGHLLFLAELSERHRVPVPERLQPKVELLRSGLPLPPDHRWRQFLAKKAELDDRKWKEYEARLRDAGERDKAEAELIKRFWEQNPSLLKQIREEARKKRPRPGEPGFRPGPP